MGARTRLIPGNRRKLEVQRNVQSGVQDAATTGASKQLQSADWEVDFCSRPLKDDRGKRVWEVLVTDPQRSFEYSEYLPNSRINSGELARALQRAAEAFGMELPKRAKFFRPQMQTIITRALSEAGVQPTPSRRCFTLMSWLQERKTAVYPYEEGYDPSLPPPASFEPKAPERLPDPLRGEAWQFVALSLNEVEEECAAVSDGSQFGAAIDVRSLNLGLDASTLIPGVCVYTRRSKALAGWMAGLELANLSINQQYGQLLLETGVSDVWQYATYPTTEENTQQVQAWLQAKDEARGLHFLAVQPSESSNVADGFWLLRDFEPDV